MPAAAFVGTPTTKFAKQLQPSRARPARSSVISRANEADSGPFAPIVRTTRAVVGEKEFNQIRGKAISYHSDVIKTFCKQIGADSKIAQGVVRTAKKNGKSLGFLAQVRHACSPVGVPNAATS
eukprot:TRINITY_DN37318_c0_g1_i5.p5 TRINITY_DN37318_c0_g1~~TRINITY_DN37318_c0_g1_i5.p5  ORF type:complete len:123 (-),score=11.76 TRINITY_DN37318_c0_g1_i5:471-839(-)